MVEDEGGMMAEYKLDPPPSESIPVSRQRNLESLQRNAGELFLKALADPRTIELMLNPDGVLWQERLGEEMQPIGRMEAYRAEALFRVVASCLHKTITWDKPQLDGEFPLDGSRFSGALPPVVSNPIFAIRKKASKVITLDEYVASGVMTKKQRDVLVQSVETHRNVLVIGGTSSGKTTLTNALIDAMVLGCPAERIIIIEDTGEIQCMAKNVVFFHTTENVSMTLLLKQSLRLRPNRICVGEVRDHAALDLMDAWNTGHEGGIATLHANSALLGLSRLRGLVSRNEFAPKEIEEIIGEAVHRVVFIERTPQGRKVREILGVSGYSRHTGQYDVEQLA
ncbi:MAG: P-type conjugative transfer ATPase TrbB [Bilophila sp.]